MTTLSEPMKSLSFFLLEPVDLRLFALIGNRKIERTAAVPLVQFGVQHRPVRVPANQLLVLVGPVRLRQSEHKDRLEQIRFALGVRSDQNVDGRIRG